MNTKFLSKTELKKELLKLKLNSEDSFAIEIDVKNILLKSNFKDLDLNIFKLIFSIFENEKEFLELVKKLFDFSIYEKSYQKKLYAFLLKIPDEFFLANLYFMLKFMYREYLYFSSRDYIEDTIKKILKKRYNNPKNLLENIMQNFQKFKNNISNFDLENFKFGPLFVIKDEDLFNLDKEIVKPFYLELNDYHKFSNFLKINGIQNQTSIINLLYKLNDQKLLKELVEKLSFDPYLAHDLIKNDHDLFYVILQNIKSKNQFSVLFEIAKKCEIQIDKEKVFEIANSRIDKKYQILNALLNYYDIKIDKKEELYSDFEKCYKNLDYHKYLEKICTHKEIYEFILKTLEKGDYPKLFFSKKECWVAIAYNEKVFLTKMLHDSEMLLNVLSTWDKYKEEFEGKISQEKLETLSRTYFELKLNKVNFSWFDILQFHKKSIDEAFDEGRNSY